MAATYAASNLVQTVWGDRKAVICRLTGSGTYTSGGDNVDPGVFGFKSVDFIIFQPMEAGLPPANMPLFVRGVAGATPKIYLYIPGTTAQFSGTVTSAFDCIVIGQ